jgi:acyl-coenzyme A thioesterase PaaI-like protein
MSEERARPDANNCFVCGPDNPIGLRLVFRMDGDVCRSEFTPDQRHVGFDGMTHGGILYSALDDVMANWLFLQGARGYTARCEVRYREPLDIGAEVQLEGRLERRKARLAMPRTPQSAAGNSRSAGRQDGRRQNRCRSTGQLHD